MVLISWENFYATTNSISHLDSDSLLIRHGARSEKRVDEQGD